MQLFRTRHQLLALLCLLISSQLRDPLGYNDTREALQQLYPVQLFEKSPWYKEATDQKGSCSYK